MLSEELKSDSSKDYLGEVDYILKLIEVLESYPYPTDHIKIMLFAFLGKIHKRAFLAKLNSVIGSSKDMYLNLVKRPFEDLPLNSSLMNLPSYS